MTEAVMNVEQIMRHLPHRYPFMLVDRVIECEVGERLRAIKNVTANEPFFPGHFPQRLVMPGVLILEALAQATGLLAFETVGQSPDSESLYYLVGIDNAKFKSTVVPGDTLQLDVTIKRKFKTIWKFDAIASVEGEVVASAEIMCARANADA